MVNLRKIEIKKLYDLPVSKVDAVEIKKLEKGEKISILSDSMMKTMFQNENRLKYSAKLLSYYLDVSFEELLANIHLSKNTLNKEKNNEKDRRSDYVASINGSTINIEVNNNNSVEILERNMEYAHRLYSQKVKRKDDDSYTQVVQLNINNFSFIGNDKIVDIYYLQNNDQLKLSDKLIFIQIYIPNLIRKWYTKSIQELEESERYLLALVLPNVEDSLKMVEGEPIMKEYVEEAVEASEDDELLESYDKEWAMKDLGKREGLELGRSEGIELGRTSATNKIAKAMIKEKIPMETIMNVTNLSKEEIENL